MKLPPIKSDMTRAEAIRIACWHQDKADHCEAAAERSRHEIIAFRLFKLAHQAT